VSTAVVQRSSSSPLQYERRTVAVEVHAAMFLHEFGARYTWPLDLLWRSCPSLSFAQWETARGESRRRHHRHRFAIHRRNQSEAFAPTIEFYPSWEKNYFMCIDCMEPMPRYVGGHLGRSRLHARGVCLSYCPRSVCATLLHILSHWENCRTTIACTSEQNTFVFPDFSGRVRVGYVPFSSVDSLSV
jgi:hypothetical protein